MTTRLGDARALLRWARRQGASPVSLMSRGSEHKAPNLGACTRFAVTPTGIPHDPPVYVLRDVHGRRRRAPMHLGSEAPRH